MGRVAMVAGASFSALWMFSFGAGVMAGVGGAGLGGAGVGG